MPKKYRIIKGIRRSCITGKAVCFSYYDRRKSEWEAYKRACKREVERMRQWSNVVSRRQKNILKLLNELTANLPIIGDVPPEKREAARFLAQMAASEPPKQSDFYDHICEEKRQKRNARRREKRWQEKYGNKK